MNSLIGKNIKQINRKNNNSYLHGDSPLCQYNWCGVLIKIKLKHENSIKQQQQQRQTIDGFGRILLEWILCINIVYVKLTHPHNIQWIFKHTHTLHHWPKATVLPRNNIESAFSKWPTESTEALRLTHDHHEEILS